jgi:N-acetylated-alpha-linked acidic dipeptidase
MGFRGDYGVYHSAYDSFHWMSQFGDPTFEYHVAAGQLWGTVALRLADAEVLPFDYVSYAGEVRRFFQESLRTAKTRNLGALFNENEMNAALEEFTNEAHRFEQSRKAALAEAANESTSSIGARLRRINDAMLQAERGLIDERGLRGRPWYRHQVYAPGFYTGYAAQPLPDFRQAIDDGNEANAKEALSRIVTAIRRTSATLRNARD